MVAAPSRASGLTHHDGWPGAEAIPLASSSGEASWLAYRPTKEGSKNFLWCATHVLRTFLAEIVVF
eukprot:1888489-Pyramimonas_sp.AAC.1